MKIRSFWGQRSIFEREIGVLATGKLKKSLGARKRKKKNDLLNSIKKIRNFNKVYQSFDTHGG